MDHMRIEWIEKQLTEAEGLINANQVDQGLAILNGLLYDEPAYASLHNHLGWAYLYYTTDTANAELHLRMAITFEKDFAAPYLHLGTLYLRNTRYNEALQYLEAGLTKTEANKVAILESIGRVHECMGSYKKAIKAYKQALLASMATFEINNLSEGIKRCRKKRIVVFFTF
jgi:tetratricopeptide (TPR) repeat protein